ncbi:hypothetical protein GF377_09045 [candidate division GN15 bacterium]|nr:hypothetical protein [candidate division GN15 bacterium]
MELPGADKKVKERLRRIEEAAQRISDVNRKLLGIDTIVSEVYLDDPKERMLNLEKSAPTGSESSGSAKGKPRRPRSTTR